MDLKLDFELAEILGVLIADGCIQKEYFCVWGNIKEDRAYYDEVLVPLFSKKFNKKIRSREKKSNSVYGFNVCSKEAIHLLTLFGLKAGSKTYTVEVPKQILESNDTEIICSFLRGFADCDGSLTFDKGYGNYADFKKKYNYYPRIILVSVSKELIEQINFLLIKIGFKTSILVNKPKDELAATVYRIFIRGEQNLEKWMKLIGFHNPVQKTRYEIWKKFGFCPPRTSILERQKLLKGELNPYKLYNGPVA